MAGRIEDYALIGDCETAALVGRDGSIDWLGMPRFDSPAFFAALLGTPSNGRWRIAPLDQDAKVIRRYRPRSLVLETTFETAAGAVVLIDSMGAMVEGSEVVRLVRGLRGRVRLGMELVLRFEYGSMVPWVTRLPDGRLTAVAGPERVTLATPVPFRGEDMRTVAEFEVGPGDEVPFVLTWSESFRPVPDSPDPRETVERSGRAWERWCDAFAARECGEWAEPVLRSLITLKALTHHVTGGIVAAPTTSLPEALGGERNWDYRYCWLRDSTLTLYALTQSGFRTEARDWCRWLRRAVAGAPEQMQILYGVAGERRIPEFELPWLAGYEGSRPVRVGNAAATQLQLDVYGEVIDTLYQARRLGLTGETDWPLERALLLHLETIWEEPDEGMWEVRGGRRHFTLSKAMVWAAFDRGIRAIEEFGLDGPIERWRAVRAAVHETICREGFDPELDSFVQFFGGRELDASLLLLPTIGFLPPDEPRIRGTVAAVERHLMRDGFLLRYDTASAVDGLPGREGVFLACSFWLADAWILQGRMQEARALFERLLGLCNDVGLLAEEYDPVARRLVGNFPQAFSHVALVDTAFNLTKAQGPARMRADRGGDPGHAARAAE